MLALGLSVLLFTLWSCLGLAVLRLVDREGDGVEQALLAPVVGLSALLLPLFWVHRLGVPLATCAWPLTLVLLVPGLIILRRRKPGFRLPQVAPFLTLLAISLLLAGWPAIQMGFDWLSYCNDDMANYCLSAGRSATYGFFERPPLETLIQGRDYTHHFWFMHVGAGQRAGSEILLGYTSSCTGLTPFQVFMPVILALQLALVSGVAAMTRRATHSARVALAAGLALTCSPMFVLGTQYQLIAQVFGLALAGGLVTLAFRPFGEGSLSSRCRTALPPALVAAALTVAYPEVIPFVVLAYLVFLGSLALKGRMRFGATLAVAGLAVTLAALLVNRHLFEAVSFLFNQLGDTTNSDAGDFSLFPYFLIPAGPAYLFGFQNINGLTPDPLLTVTILAGFLLVGTGLFALGRCLGRGEPAACMLLVMVLLTVVMFVDQKDFGVFKLAMYVQPFLWACLVGWWFRQPHPSPLRMAAYAILILAMLPNTLFYTSQSRGLPQEIGTGLVEIPDASRSAINSRIRELVDAQPPGVPLVSDSANVVLSKFQSYHTRGRATQFPCFPDFLDRLAFLVIGDPAKRSPLLGEGDLQLLAATEEAARRTRVDARYPLLQAERIQALSADRKNKVTLTTHHNRFDAMRPIHRGTEFLLCRTHGNLTALNHYTAPQVGDRRLSILPGPEVRNHLIFKASLAGQLYFTPLRKQVALYQTEPDLMFKGRHFCGAGRHILLRILRPSPRVRLLVSLTTTLLADGRTQLPPLAVRGRDWRKLDLRGRGAARVVTPPLQPFTVGEAGYLALDMGRRPQVFPTRRRGLMRLYGRHLPLDNRYLTCFLRDISALSEEEFQALRPPAVIDEFPRDLMNRQVLYAGLGEDGWVGERAWIELSQPPEHTALVVGGEIPRIDDPDYRTELKIQVDGVTLLREERGPGAFRRVLTVPRREGRRRVDLLFDRIQHLRESHDRPVAALLHRIGFHRPGEAAALAAPDIVATPALRLGPGWGLPERWEGELFRWVGVEPARLTLPAGAGTLELLVEGGHSLAEGHRQLELVGPKGERVLHTFTPGPRTTVRLAIGADSPRSLAIRPARPGTPTAVNGRILAWRALRIAWVRAD